MRPVPPSGPGSTQASPFEVLFGLPGLASAPVLSTQIKQALHERGLPRGVSLRGPRGMTIS